MSWQNHWEKSGFTPVHMRTEEVLARELYTQEPIAQQQPTPIETFVVPAEKSKPKTEGSMFDISNDMIIIILLVVVALLLLRSPRHYPHPQTHVILVSK